MLPADGTGASEAPASGASPAATRLAAALDRIAGALVRRAEADAAIRDRFEREQQRRDDEAARGAELALDSDTVDELRHRVDAAIGRVRAALGEA